MRRHRMKLLLLLLAGIAVSSLVISQQAPKPLWTRVVKHCQGAMLTGDGQSLITLHERTITILSLNGQSATNTRRGPLRVWDAATGLERFHLLDEEDGDSAYAPSPDGRRLALWSRKTGLQLWDVATGNLEQSILPPSATSTSDPLATFSLDGRILIWGSDAPAVHVWDIEAGKQRTVLPGAGWPYAFSPDSQTLAVSLADGRAELVDVASGEVRSRLYATSPRIESVGFSGDGKLLVTRHVTPSLNTGELNLWDVDSGTLRWKHALGVINMNWYFMNGSPTFSPDNRLLVVPGINREHAFWDLTTDPPTSLAHHLVEQPLLVDRFGNTMPRWAPWPAFSADGSQILLPGQELGTLEFLNVDTWQPTVTFRHHVKQMLWSARLLPDGRTVKLMTNGRYTSSEAPSAWQSLVYRLTSPPPETTISRGTTILFDAATGRELAELPGMNAPFSADGKYVYVGDAQHSTLDNQCTLHLSCFEIAASGSRRALLVAVTALALFIVLSAYWLGVRWRFFHRIVSPTAESKPELPGGLLQ